MQCSAVCCSHDLKASWATSEESVLSEKIKLNCVSYRAMQQMHRPSEEDAHHKGDECWPHSTVTTSVLADHLIWWSSSWWDVMEKASTGIGAIAEGMHYHQLFSGFIFNSMSTLVNDFVPRVRSWLIIIHHRVVDGSTDRLLSVGPLKYWDTIWCVTI